VLVRRVYAYVAYRIGPGPDADDVTSDTFERALRYRDSYDRRKGEPIAWLLGIAQRCIADNLAGRGSIVELVDVADTVQLEEEIVTRIDLQRAVAALPERDRELIALRYGADLKSKQIAVLIGLSTNAVEVALHRALARLRAVLAGDTTGSEWEQERARPAVTPDG
jgi:RNA polymerase sigma-70 factor, ECF subfamily